jgi:hypothetical protein
MLRVCRLLAFLKHPFRFQVAILSDVVLFCLGEAGVEKGASACGMLLLEDEQL